MFSYVQPFRILVRRWSAAVTLAVVSLITFPAMAVTAGDLFNPVTGQISGSSMLLDFGANGNFSRVFTPSAAATIVSDGSNTLALSRGIYVPNPSGVLVPVNVAARVPSSEVAVLVKKALPLVPVLATGVALYDLAKELGYIVDNSTGTLQAQKLSNTLACTTAPCNLFLVNQSYGANQLYLYKDQLCGYYLSLPSLSGYSCTPYSSDPNSGTMVLQKLGTSCAVYNSCQAGASGVKSTSVVETPIYSPTTVDDFIKAIISASGWPSNSAVSQALVDAQKLTGTSVKTNVPTVTGPATSTGNSTTTVNPDGSKVVVTTTYNHTYNNNTQVTNATTTTQNYNPSGALTSTTTASSTSPAAPEQKTDCDKYPDDIGCSKYGDPVDQTLKTADSGFSAITPVTFSAAAGCPAPLTFTAGGGSYSFSYSSLCSAANDYVRPVVIVLGAALAMFAFVGGFKV